MKIASIMLLVLTTACSVALSRRLGQEEAEGKSSENLHNRIESHFVNDYVLVPPEKKDEKATSTTENLYWTDQCTNPDCDHGSWYWNSTRLQSVHNPGCMAISTFSTPNFHSLILSNNCDYDENQEWKLYGKKRLCSLGIEGWCAAVGDPIAVCRPREEPKIEYNAVLTRKTWNNKPEQLVEFNVWPPPV